MMNEMARFARTVIGSQRTARMWHTKGMKLIDNKAFAVIMNELLDSDVTALKILVKSAADILIGGGAKRAFTVVSSKAPSLLAPSMGVIGPLLQAEVDPMMLVDDPGFVRMAGKLVAKGLIQDMLVDPGWYSKFLSGSLRDELVIASGRRKFEVMLENAR